MELAIEQAALHFEALASPMRLNIVRQLMYWGTQGQYAGELAKQLNIAPNALSFHLKHLSHVGLLSAQQEGRYIRYTLRVEVLQQLILFLTDTCCQHQPQACFATLPTPPHTKEPS